MKCKGADGKETWRDGKGVSLSTPGRIFELLLPSNGESSVTADEAP